MNLKSIIIGVMLAVGGFCLVTTALGAPIEATAVLDTTPGWNASAGPGLLTDEVIGGNEWINSGQYLGWADPGYVILDSGVDSGVPQPQLTFDLGREYFVDSVTIHYIVDYPPGTLRANLRAPDSMTATFSLSGTSGPFDGSVVASNFDDSPAGGPQARSLTVNLGGAVANAVQLDFRTDGEWLFLSEVTFQGRAATNAPVAAVAILDTPAGYNGSAGPGLLTDGSFGGSNWLAGTYMGWADPGYVPTPPDSGTDSAVPQPQLTFDLGTNYFVHSVTIHYIVDYPPEFLRANVHAPDSLTVMFSGSGTNGPFGGNLVETAFDDSPENDVSPGGGQARSLTVALGDTLANAVRLDFRTDGEWLFLSEVVLNVLMEATNAPPPPTNVLISATATLDTTPGWNAAAGPGLLTDGVIGGNEWIVSGQYQGWSDPGYVVLDGGLDSAVPQPQLSFDLVDNYFLDSVTIHYIVDYPPGTARANLRAPDSMTVMFSTSGINGPFGSSLVETGFDDSPENNTTSGGGQARSLTMALHGTPANALLLDFRTDGEWLFISEVIFRGRAVTNIPTPITTTATLDSAPGWNAASGPGLLTDGIIGGNEWLGSGQYLGWADPGYVPTPPDSGTDSAVPQPQLTFDFGARYFIQSVTLHYMVDYPPDTLRANLRAPDSMTAMFSATGPGGPFGGNLVETAFDDGPEQNGTPGWGQARSLTMDLGATVANAVRLDFRTDGEWLFLSEVIFKGTAVPEVQPAAAVNVAGGLTTMILSFDTTPGLWYRVVRADSLPSLNWTEVVPGWRQGTGLPMEIVDSASSVERPRGFYQIEISPTQP